MPSQVFRQSSIDRLESPEELNQYVRVARPSVWIVLAAVIAVLVGVALWAVFGTVTSTIPVLAHAEDGVVTCYVAEARAPEIRDGQTVRIGDHSGPITYVAPGPETLGWQEAPADASVLQMLGFDIGEGYRRFEADIPDVEAGAHIAEVTIESIRPISFVTQ